MTIKRGAIYAAVIAIILGASGLYLWDAIHRVDQRRDADIKAPTLKETETAKIIVDTRHHTITTVTRRADGKIDTKATFLPPSGASVSVGLDRSVLVTSRSWGTEVNPFVGCSLGSDVRGRAALGLNLFYVQRWELGGGLLLSSDIHDTRVFAHVSYNAYGNIFISGGIDNRKTAQLIAGLKF